jgi:FkbM family methyltransferase
MLKDLPDSHDSRSLETLLSYVKKHRVAVDIGAHRGIWTKRFCDLFETVHAFEPTELSSQIDGRAIVHKVALGASEGKCAMQEGAENTGQTHVVPGESTEVLKLDSFNLLNVDLIKIDVEGYELFVLEGAINTILSNKPIILIEENGLNKRYGIKDMAAKDLLESWGAVQLAIVNKDYIYGFNS